MRLGVLANSSLAAEMGSVLLMAPVSVLFIAAGARKVIDVRSFRYKLVEWGLTPLATPVKVRTLGIFELSGGMAALVAPGAGWLLALPVTVLILVFTVFLIAKRPPSCGCGFLDANWAFSAIRNMCLSALLVFSLTVQGYA